MTNAVEDYVRESGLFFGSPGRDVYDMLKAMDNFPAEDHDSQIKMVAERLKVFFDQKKPIPTPVPKEVVDYIGNNRMGMNLYLAVLPTE